MLRFISGFSTDTVCVCSRASYCLCSGCCVYFLPFCRFRFLCRVSHVHCPFVGRRDITAQTPARAVHFAWPLLALSALAANLLAFCCSVSHRTNTFANQRQHSTAPLWSLTAMATKDRTGEFTKIRREAKQKRAELKQSQPAQADGDHKIDINNGTATATAAAAALPPDWVDILESFSTDLQNIKQKCRFLLFCLIVLWFVCSCLFLFFVWLFVRLSLFSSCGLVVYFSCVVSLFCFGIVWIVGLLLFSNAVVAGTRWASSANVQRRRRTTSGDESRRVDTTNHWGTFVFLSLVFCCSNWWPVGV